MSGSEVLSALDAVNAEIARLKTRGLHLVAGLEDNGWVVADQVAVRPDPWGESGIPEHAGRRNRWANQTTLEEAARFAVWGETTRNGEPIGASPPRGR